MWEASTMRRCRLVNDKAPGRRSGPVVARIEKRKGVTVIDQIHQSSRCADSDAGLLALEERYLLLDLHVLCKLMAG